MKEKIVDENDDLRRKRTNFKMRRNNSCIDLRPTRRKKISVTCLKFAKNVSKDNDGIIFLIGNAREKTGKQHFKNNNNYYCQSIILYPVKISLKNT